jgi:hypothetical protein
LRDFEDLQPVGAALHTAGARHIDRRQFEVTGRLTAAQAATEAAADYVASEVTRPGPWVEIEGLD